jgi:hypothetical protein
MASGRTSSFVWGMPHKMDKVSSWLAAVRVNVVVADELDDEADAFAADFIFP